jgi:AMP-binding enzyme
VLGQAQGATPFAALLRGGRQPPEVRIDPHADLAVLPYSRFDLEQFLAILQDYRVTTAAVVPPIMLAMAEHPLVDRFDLSALRFLGSGAAPLGAELEEACGKRVGCVVGQGYGLTETSPVVTAHPSEEARIRHGRAGQLLPNTEAKVVDPATGEALGRNRDGELCFRGPQVMRGYLTRPQETAQMLDPDGWLHSGDIGHVEDDGYVYVVDRVKELIKYKGLQVARPSWRRCWSRIRRLPMPRWCGWLMSRRGRCPRRSWWPRPSCRRPSVWRPIRRSAPSSSSTRFQGRCRARSWPVPGGVMGGGGDGLPSGSGSRRGGPGDQPRSAPRPLRLAGSDEPGQDLAATAGKGGAPGSRHPPSTIAGDDRHAARSARRPVAVGQPRR